MKGPWYITMTAVEQYCALTKRDAEDDQQFDDAEDELTEIAATAKHSRNQDNGLMLYRATRSPRCAERYRLLVSPTPTREGNLPQLVRVMPESDQGGRSKPAMLPPGRLDIELPGATLQQLDEIAQIRRLDRAGSLIRLIAEALAHWRNKSRS